MIRHSGMIKCSGMIRHSGMIKCSGMIRHPQTWAFKLAENLNNISAFSGHNVKFINVTVLSHNITPLNAIILNKVLNSTMLLYCSLEDMNLFLK
jgi:hypothetical protein